MGTLLKKLKSNVISSGNTTQYIHLNEKARKITLKKHSLTQNEIRNKLHDTLYYFQQCRWPNL